jgi:phosphatidylserine synthase
MNALQVLDSGAPAHVLVGPQLPAKTAGPLHIPYFPWFFVFILIILNFLAVSPLDSPAMRNLTQLLADISLQPKQLVLCSIFLLAIVANPFLRTR